MESICQRSNVIFGQDHARGGFNVRGKHNVWSFCLDRRHHFFDGCRRKGCMLAVINTTSL